MVSSHIIFPEFRDEQGESKYPFADYATLQATDSNVSFRKDVFLDAVFYPIGGGTAVYISSVVISVNKITIFARSVDPEITISAEYDPLELPATNTLSFYDEYGRPAGAMIFDRDRIVEITQWGIGTYVFTRAATEIVSTLFIPAQEPGVRALTVDGKEFITGDVCLVGADGVVLTEQDGVIRVDVVGVPLFQRAACDAAGKNKQPQRFVATINDCGPDEFGNFTITATDLNIVGNDTTVLRVYPSDFGLFIEAAGRSNI
jgi:hypothetical protein